MTKQNKKGTFIWISVTTIIIIIALLLFFTLAFLLIFPKEEEVKPPLTSKTVEYELYVLRPDEITDVGDGGIGSFIPGAADPLLTYTYTTDDIDSWIIQDLYNINKVEERFTFKLVNIDGTSFGGAGDYVILLEYDLNNDGIFSIADDVAFPIWTDLVPISETIGVVDPNVSNYNSESNIKSFDYSLVTENDETYQILLLPWYIGWTPPLAV